jgi:hypothetical protein
MFIWNHTVGEWKSVPSLQVLRSFFRLHGDVKSALSSPFRKPSLENKKNTRQGDLLQSDRPILHDMQRSVYLAKEKQRVFETVQPGYVNMGRKKFSCKYPNAVKIRGLSKTSFAQETRARNGIGWDGSFNSSLNRNYGASVGSQSVTRCSSQLSNFCISSSLMSNPPTSAFSAIRSLCVLLGRGM